jgi:peptidoglycan/LPS O-acetylase OafA/YrhL
VLDGLKRRPYAPWGVEPIDFVTTALFLHGWQPSTINAIVPGGWSIAAEAGFYLLFPFLAATLTDLRRALLALGVTLAAAGAWAWAIWAAAQASLAGPQGYLVKAFVLWGLPLQLPVFLIGFVVYHLAFPSGKIDAEPTAREVARGRVIVAAAVGAGLLLSFLPARASGAAYLPFAALFGALVFGLRSAPWPLLVNRVTIYVGRVSYSAYFLHFLVIRFLPPRLPQLGPYGDLGFVAYYLIVVAATVALATLTHRYVELPGIAIGRRLAARISDRSARPFPPPVAS